MSRDQLNKDGQYCTKASDLCVLGFSTIKVRVFVSKAMDLWNSEYLKRTLTK